jgi:tetratricopeptide (TPR) repeat protein
MKKMVGVVSLFVLALLCVVPAVAQSTGSVKGTCRDMEGKPIAGATVEFMSVDSGQKRTLKTNNKGEYFSLGFSPGKYNVTLTRDGQVVDKVSNFPVTLDENTLDFDLKKSQVQAAEQQGISAEQLKKMQEQQAKVTKENDVIKQLNEKLNAANTASQAGDFDTAIAQLTEATQMDANRDLLWFKLADAYRNSASKQSDSSEKGKRYTEAVNDYQKAIDLKQKAVETDPKKAPEAEKQIAAYYNNMAEAYAKQGKVDDAVKSYASAAQADPTGSSQYLFNTGAVLTNANRVDEAVAAFDKVIAADPNKADAYYWKGVNLVSKATTDKTGKVVPAPGTEEALNKYLELQPTGPYADGAKGMIQYIGGSIETSYGKSKKTKK